MNSGMRNSVKFLVSRCFCLYTVVRINKRQEETKEKMKKLYKDQVLGLIMVAFSLLAGYMTSKIGVSILDGDPGPKVFPSAASVLIGLCGIVLFVAPEKKEGKPFLTKTEWKRLINLYGLYLLYWGLLWLVGYRVAIPVVLFIISYLFSNGTNTKIGKIILYTAAVSAAIIFIYVVLMETRLPEGILFENFF